MINFYYESKINSITHFHYEKQTRRSQIDWVKDKRIVVVIMERYVNLSNHHFSGKTTSAGHRPPLLVLCLAYTKFPPPRLLRSSIHLVGGSISNTYAESSLGTLAPIHPEFAHAIIIITSTFYKTSSPPTSTVSNR